MFFTVILLPFVLAQSANNLNYEPDILEKFNENEMVSVLVRLKSAENFDLSKQILLEQRAINYERKKEIFRPT